MPREFLPQKRKREPRGNAELFPRTERHIELPCRDRMMHEDRRKTKQRLRYAAERLEHVRD